VLVCVEQPHLTADQIGSIVQSFRFPVRTKQDVGTQSILGKEKNPHPSSIATSSFATSLLSPPGPLPLAVLNETTPVSEGVLANNGLPVVAGVNRKRCYIEMEGADGKSKRVKLELNTPPSPQHCAAAYPFTDLAVRPKVKSSSMRSLKFLYDGSEAPISVSAANMCHSKPVASRPQRFTVQVSAAVCFCIRIAQVMFAICLLG
jgi:hypothetical protein